jgi:hypothetical protein
MSKLKSFKIWLIFTLLFLGFTNANAVSVGDRVYVVLGDGSSAYVKKAHVSKVGDATSKVDWTNCSTCARWVSNARFYYSYDSAQKIVDKMDAEDISFAEIAGTAIVIGGIVALIQAMSK